MPETLVVHAQPVNGEYDTDGDGLIEIEFLEQFDAIRYDLDGDGRADDDAGVDAYAAAFPGTVCNDNCNGYELARPLDFNHADSYASGAVSAAWTTGEGWQPIQSGEVWIVAENRFPQPLTATGTPSATCTSTSPTTPKTLPRPAFSVVPLQIPSSGRWA